MIAIGVGCRKAAPAADILALVEAALADVPDGVAAVGPLHDRRQARRAGPGAGGELACGLPLVFLDPAVLQLVAGGARSCSRRVEEMFQLPSVAETAALAGAGQGAVLLVPRRSCATATCAVAGRLA